MSQSVNNSGQWITLMAVAMALLLSSATAVADDEVPSVAVEQLDAQVTSLEENYLVPVVLESRYEVESRFNEAKVAYLLEDYGRASILFVAVIDSAEPAQFGSYSEALYLLGDSLFHMRNYRAAREYFRDVVQMGPGPYYQPAIVRLLELAAEIDDYEGVDELYNRLDDLEDVSASIHYTRGKTLYQEGRLRSAQPWFQRAARDDEYAFAARYFEGVTLAASGDLAQADDIFQSLTRRTPQSRKNAEIVELAHMARGRLAYEDENYDVAIDHYLQVPRTSPHFTRSLYELTWALVAQESYEAALRNLDILMISEPDPRFVPEAQSLMADMAMRVGEYEEARYWFGELVDTFVPVRRQLQDFIDDYDELDEFFVGLVRDELEGLQPEFLPDKVTEWVEDDERMQQARQLVRDGSITQNDIDATYEAIDEIETVIEMGSAIEVFPRLAEGWIQGMELEARLLDVEEQLLDWELQQVRPLMSSEDERRLNELEEELQKLQRRESRAPRTREELEARDKRLQEQFRSLKAELDQIVFEIEGLEQTLEAIGEYVRRDADRWSEQERQEVANVRRRLQQELDELEADRRELAAHVRQTERAFGARDESLIEHRRLREQIQQLQAERAELVDRKAGDMEPGQLQRMREVSEARRQLPRVQDRLDRYFDRIDTMVDERMAEIKTTLEAERAELAAHQADLEQWTEGTEQTVAELAMWNFIQIDGEFDTLVRRGRVGLVDVDWQQLDDATRDREYLEEEKRKTEEMLREAFPEVD